MPAYLDESLRFTGEGLYLLAAVVIPPEDLGRTRDGARSVLIGKQPRFHWRNERETQRRRMLDVIAELGPIGLTCWATLRATRQECARARCLTRMLWDLGLLGTADIVFESRGRDGDRKDARTIANARRARIAPTGIRYRFENPNAEPVLRGRGDRVLARMQAGWSSWRGRAIEPVVREALARLLPIGGLVGPEVSGYWTRSNTPEVDLVGADRAPVANRIGFTGSIKWFENRPLDAADLGKLARDAAAVPGAGPDTPLVAVSRSGVTAKGAAMALGPEDLLAAWPSSQAA